MTTTQEQGTRNAILDTVMQWSYKEGFMAKDNPKSATSIHEIKYAVAQILNCSPDEHGLIARKFFNGIEDFRNGVKPKLEYGDIVLVVGYGKTGEPRVGEYDDSYGILKVSRTIVIPKENRSSHDEMLQYYDWYVKAPMYIKGFNTIIGVNPKDITLLRKANANQLSDSTLPPTQRFTPEQFAQSVRDWVVMQNIEKLESRVEVVVAQIEQLDTVPANWQLTQQAYFDSVKDRRSEFAYERDEARKKITRLRNNELYDVEQVELQAEITALAEANNYRVPENIRTWRLERLMERVFEEDKSEQFYPTPIPVVQRMIAEANIQSGMRVLEPSAGKGNIADMVREMHPDATIECIEINPIRAEILRLKGYTVYEQDALTVTADQAGTFDRILMNPPFLKTLGAKHVRYMFDNLLDVNGRLVALLNAGAYSDKNDLQSVQFKRFVDMYGRAVGIDKETYNKDIERSIGIHIGMFVVDKPEEAVDLTPVQEIPVEIGTRLIDKYDRQRYKIIEIVGDSVTLNNEDTGSQRTVKAKDIKSAFELNTATTTREFALVRNTEVDTTFREPSILTARQQFTQKSPVNYVPARFESILKWYQKDGVNLAMNALETKGGFLLTDGTGTGKTMQEIVLAYTMVEKHNRPAIIFTESDQIIQQSFFGDARRLGLETPDASEYKTKVYQRSATYKGLYDNTDAEQAWAMVQSIIDKYSLRRSTLPQDKRNEIETIIAGLCAIFGKTPVYGAVPQSGNKIIMRRLDASNLNLDKNTIYVGTYNDMSISDLNDAPEVIELIALRKKWNEKKAEYARERKIISDTKSLTKEEQKQARKEIRNRELNDPLQTALIRQEDIIEAMNKARYGKLAEQSAVVIYDECHNLKNTADAKTGSFRAMRGRLISEASPRVMFVSATPADKAGDLFYLKECGLYQYPAQFHRLMSEVGFEYKPPKTNDRGELIRRGMFAEPKDFNIAKASIVLAREFDRLTEDGQMLKREIELANLEPVRMVDVPINAKIVDDLMLDIAEALNEEYRKRRSKGDDDEKESTGAPKSLVLMEQKRALESFKLEATVEHTLRELSEGRSVVIFVDMVEEGEEEKAWGAKKVGSARTLKSRLGEVIGDNQIGFVTGVAGEYEKQERLRHIREFQEGKRRVMIATVGSGGTGISLDDTVGNMPRTILIVTAPMSSIKTIQVIGRVVRANTKSRSRVLFLFADTAIDEWLKNLLATKIMMLGGVVSGQVTMMQPSEVEALESGGDESFAGASSESEKKPDTAVVAKSHSLYEKLNMWLDGREYPRNRPLLLGNFTDTLSAYDKNRRLIRIKARSKGEIDRFGKEYEKTLEKFGFKRDSDRFNGTFYEALATDEAWLWAINLLSEESASVVITPEQLYREGDMVVASEDITNHNVAFGTAGRIVTVRPRNGFYLYDVQFGDKLIRSLAQEALSSGTELTDKSEQNGMGELPEEILAHLKKKKQPFLTGKEAYTKWQSDELTDIWYLQYVQLLLKHGFFRSMSEVPLPEELQGLSQSDLAEIEAKIQSYVENPENMYKHSNPYSVNAYYWAVKNMAKRNRNENEDSDWQTQNRIAKGAVKNFIERLGDEEEVSTEQPMPEQTEAQQATRNTFTLNELAQVKGKPIALPTEWRNVLGNVEMPFVMGVYGMAGNGKSSAMLHLSQHLAKFGRVLFVNAEESASIMANRVRELGVNIPQNRFAVLFTNDMQTMLDAVEQADIIIIDSIGKIRTNRKINNRDMKPVDYIEWLKAEYPTKTFIVLLHSLKSGASYKGDSAFGHDPDILLQVASHTVSTVKNRFGTYGEYKLPKPKGRV